METAKGGEEPRRERHGKTRAVVAHEENEFVLLDLAHFDSRLVHSGAKFRSIEQILESDV